MFNVEPVRCGNLRSRVHIRFGRPSGVLSEALAAAANTAAMSVSCARLQVRVDDTGEAVRYDRLARSLSTTLLAILQVPPRCVRGV